MSVLMLWPPSLCLLGVDMNSLACHCGETGVLVFDPVVVAKALVQFEHQSEVLIFNLDASLEATEQFEEGMKVEGAFLGHCLRLHLDCFVFTFGCAGVAVLPSNMVDAGLRQIVSSFVGGR